MNDTTFQCGTNQIDRFTTVYTRRLRSWMPTTKSILLLQIEWSLAVVVCSPLGQTTSDFCEMLINLGEWNGTRLLEPETVVQMTQNQLPKDVLALWLVWVRIWVQGTNTGLGR